MDTKKDIGQFFNDRLNQMDYSTNENGWDKIESELEEKKRKKRNYFRNYFFSFLSGCFLTLIAVYSNNLFNSNSEINNKLINSNIESNPNENINSTSNKNLDYNFKENILTTKKNITTHSNDNNPINEKTSTKYLNKNMNNVVLNKGSLLENNISNTPKLKQTSRNKNSKINSKNLKTNKNTYSLKTKFSKTKFYNKSNSKQKEKNLTFKKNTKGIKSSKINNISTTLDKSNTITLNNKLIIENLDSINSNNIVENEIIKNDTTTIPVISKKIIKKTEKLLVKDSTKIVTNKESDLLIISPYFGFGLSNKNQVTGNFNSINKLKISNENYGISLRWMFNKKHGIQSGLGYINYSTKTEIEKTNSNYLSFDNVTNNSNVSFTQSNKLILVHNLSMIEVPLEFYYNLTNHKISLAFAAGMSTSIIKNNEIYIELPQEKNKIGELQSILNQNFSINLKTYGIYKFSNKLQLELYPSFQYQFLNTIKDKQLNSYILSIKAGLSYQF